MILVPVLFCNGTLKDNKKKRLFPKRKLQEYALHTKYFLICDTCVREKTAEKSLLAAAVDAGAVGGRQITRKEFKELKNNLKKKTGVRSPVFSFNRALWEMESCVCRWYTRTNRRR